MLNSRKYLWLGFGAVELLALLALFTRPAYGYVDPGSGLLAIQVGGSMLAGGLFLVRSKLRKLLRTSRSVESAHPENPQDDGPERG